jgi:hypothetical protein
MEPLRREDAVVNEGDTTMDPGELKEPLDVAKFVKPEKGGSTKPSLAAERVLLLPIARANEERMRD